MKTIFLNILVLMTALLSTTSLAGAPPHISAEQLREDLTFIQRTITQVHPDPAFSAPPATIHQAMDAIAADAAPDMTQDETWRRLATLNPLFADAHLFIGYADWRGDSAAHLKSGGGFFPFELDIDGNGEVLIRAALGGGASELAGARILSINGVPSAQAKATLLKLTHGDTLVFRSTLLAQRWWLYHWKVYGAASSYHLELARGEHRWAIDVPASLNTPAIVQDDQSFERQFGFEVRPDKVAVLKAGSFDGAFKECFLSLTRAAFTRMRQEGVSTLVIDISENGGGDDDLWLEGLMPYLATKPYRTGSTYKKRVLESDPARREIAGQVVDGEIQTWHQPPADNPLLFKGKVVVVIGPSTYSSAVLFANVMKDFDFGTLTGTGMAARRSQSGGIRKFILPNSGLALWVPRFVLDPPAGAQAGALLVPSDTHGHSHESGNP